MTKNLVIVESPAKAKTIGKFLGKEYTVMSSYGHIRDLRKKDLSIDIDKGFEPIYEIPADKKKLVADLQKAARQAETIFLASDEDREGEAIAWHLCQVLGLNPETTRRIVFHEITKNAILNAVANPRTIDTHLVDAQQARRVLDRLVGFELSPVLWKKIKPALSAGRVQSVAVRLICEREAEIKAFTPEQYYRVTARFLAPDGTSAVKAELSHRLSTEADAHKLLDDCAKADFTVNNVKVAPVKRSPYPPFTTSTLQQEAARRLGFSVAMTMNIAQKLYEAGHITYMRTDSLNLSSLALNTIAAEIKSNFGENYLKIRKYHTSSKGAQEAHEAIRPTYIDKETITGTAAEQKLYNLIRRRTLASQMADAQLEKTTVEIDISSRNEHFVAQGETLKFDGFLKVYFGEKYIADDENGENGEAAEAILPPLKNGDALTSQEITATERFTLAPARYTEGSLVRKLEELGIGRPSTYAPTISTIQQREYVEKGEKKGETRYYNVLTLADGKVKTAKHSEQTGADKGKLIPTDTGIIVNEFLNANFPEILDYDFTARMEQNFDHIAEGDATWSSEIGEFYNMFHPAVERANGSRTEHKVGERILGTDPNGQPVSVKIGRFGPVVQIGDAKSDVKPRFASLRPGQSVFDLTLEEALHLFDLPRTLGTAPDGSEIKAAIGRFGPYVAHAGVFASIPKDLSPLGITLEQALELLEAKKKAEAKKVLKTFDEEPEISVLNGRYGPYIAYKKQNFKIPKTVADPAALTLEECRAIIEAEPAKPKRTSRAKAKK